MTRNTTPLEKNIAIRCAHIFKSYGENQALNGVSLEVERGEIFGLIGPDGAGKTSLFRILTTLILADSGTASVDDFDVVKQYKEIRKRVGYMPGKFSLYQDLTVEENLEFFATVFNTTISENYELVKEIYQQIEPFKNRRAGNLSGGMKQKLALSCALIHKPSILFLDEPTTGVDPVSRREFWDILRKLKNEGISMLVSTPYMDEASMCDRIALIQRGKFLKTDRPEAIVNQYKSILWAVKCNNMTKLLTDLREHKAIHTCFAFGDSHHATINEVNFSTEMLRQDLTKLQHTHIDIKIIQPTIEDCFMELQ